MAAPIRKVSRGRRRWLLDLRGYGGRREFYATRDLAEAAREVALADSDKHGSAVLSLSVEERAELVRLRDRAEKLGGTLEMALDFWAANRPRTVSLPFSEAQAVFLESKRLAKKSALHLRQLRLKLDQFSRHVGPGTLVSAIKLSDVETWLFKNGWSSASIRNRLIDLKTFFRFSLARGWCSILPTVGIEAPEPDETVPGILSVEHCAALLIAARSVAPQAVGSLVLGMFAGLRDAEICRLATDAVHMDRGFVEVSARVAKSRQRRLVDLSENAKAWLRTCPFVPGVHVKAIGKACVEAAKVLGLETFPWPRNCLRHSFASYHLAMHGSADKTAMQMGHRSTDMVFRHYREVVTRQEAERFWGLMP
jgi:site-specific recombinase XerD